MMKFSRIAVYAISIILLIISADASHFRFGTIDWRANSNLVTVTLTTAWRRDYRSWPSSPKVGDSFECKGGGDSCRWYPGNSRSERPLKVLLKVDTVNTIQNWLTATSVITFRYSSAGTKTAYFSTCCRLNELQNNRGESVVLQAKINVVYGVVEDSLQTRTSPIISMLINRENKVPLSVQSFTGRKLSFRFATSYEAIGSRGYDLPSGLMIDGSKGVLSWRNPGRVGLYTAQVIVEDGENSIPIDLFIKVSNPTNKFCKRFCQNAGSTCGGDGDCFRCTVRVPSLETKPFCDTNSPPRATRIDFTTFGKKKSYAPSSDSCIELDAYRDEEFKLVVFVVDDDTEDYVSVFTTASPVLPRHARITPFPANSHSGAHTITWTPKTSDIGSIISYSFTDSLAFGNTEPLCVKISVKDGKMSATGRSLTRGIAGRLEDEIFISNARGSKHVISIKGQVEADALYIKKTNDGRFQFGYNLGNPSTTITKAGSYILVIKDNNGGTNVPADLAFNLYIRNARTDPENHLIDNSEGLGIQGGVSGSFSTFLIHSRDQFGNDAIVANGDEWSAEIWYESKLVETVMAKQQVDPQFFLVNYTVPIRNVEGKFEIRIFFESRWSIRYRVKSYEAIFLSAASIKFPSDRFVFEAGSRSSLSFTASSNAVDVNNLQFTAKVNGIFIPVVSLNNGLYEIQNIEWPQQARYFELAEGLRIFAKELPGGSWSTGFTTVPGFPSVENSFVDGTEDIIASDENTLSVYLRDRFDNLIESDYSIHYSFYVDNVRNSRVKSSRTLPVSGSGGRTFLVNSIYSGNMNLSVSFSSLAASNQVQLQVPVPIEVPPGDLSVQTSSAYTEDAFAGFITKGMIISRDRWENTRFSLADIFDVTLLYGQDIVQSISGVSLVETNGERVFFFNSTIKGNHEMRVQLHRGNELRDFKSAFVEVHSGPIDKTKTNVKGDGIRAEVLAGSRASILIQPRDSYLNVIDPRDIVAQKSGYFPGYIVQIKPSDGRASQYYESEYCSPGRRSCSPVSDLSLRAFNSQSEPGSLSNEEELLGRTGYHRVYYKAPALVSGDNKFSIDIFQCNPEEFVEGDTAESKIVKPGCEKVWGTISEAVLVAGVELASQIVDPWLTVVIGVCAGSILMTAAAYAAWRLNRYKVKYRVEKKKLASAEERLREMAEDDNIIPGNGEKRFGLSMNPMLMTSDNSFPKPKPKPNRPDVELVEPPKEEVSKRAPIRREFKPALSTNLSMKFS